MAPRQGTTTAKPAAKARKDAARKAQNGAGEADRQQELLQIAADLFAERGYVATTVRDIANSAGILSGSLYHHFDTKESMIDEILSKFIYQTLASYDEILAKELSPRDTFESLITVSLESMVNNRSAILVYQNEARFLAQLPRFAYLSATHRRFEKIWTGVLERGIEAGEFRPDIDTKLIYRMVRDTVWAAPRWWHPGGSVEPERITQQYLAVLLGGVVLH